MAAGKVFVNPYQERMMERNHPIYQTKGDVRSEYYRDYTRILHSNAYRRLKHKTQVFYNIDNDHICTRMEHVNHVESVSHSIAVGLGLDLELTKAIACGHDLGHAPFGHQGEFILNQLLKENLSEDYVKRHYPKNPQKLFWHEKNGLRFVDHIELLPDPKGISRNLNLTYAVRDGIISHCGEVDENGLKPREELIKLHEFQSPGEYMPATWEGCVVKISDKIAYLGRDIEDAITLHFISDDAQRELQELAKKYVGHKSLNTTGIMHSLITDICENSSPQRGICMSPEKNALLNDIKRFNYRYIYGSRQFDTYIAYSELVLRSLFTKLLEVYDGENTIKALQEHYERLYPKMTREFVDFLGKYCAGEWVKMQGRELKSQAKNLENEKIYGRLETKDVYVRAIIDFISGMTDSYALMSFRELISFF